VDEICVTLDVDWAPDEVLRDVLDALDDNRVRATLFATHASSVLADIDPTRIEVALHPRFENLSDPADPIAELLGCYPGARGMRSHGLVVSSGILEAGATLGLVYESNHFLPLHPGLRPVFRFQRLVTIPIYWSDDHHLLLRKPFSIESLKLEEQGLKVLNFHPIHVFANTTSPDHYAAFKRHYQDPAALRALRDQTVPGTASLFHDVLARLRGTATRTLSEVHDSALG
jgi:hypothetical protein